MKKTSLLIIILFAIYAVSMAQPRAIGGRLGWTIAPSYQHQIGEKKMIQADVDFIGYALWGVQGTVTFNWLIPLVSVNAGSLNLYPGVGIGGGCDWGWGGSGLVDWLQGSKHPWFICGFVGIAGMIGLEWNFNFPLQLSIEYRPLIGPQFFKNGRYYLYENKSVGVDFYHRGLWTSAIAVGVRYKFGGK
ncbi:MAG: hypothetical protein FWD09_00680 [Lentimicrobiaceae bacterium]|nr:hypothetical protein [Lentimicrobiaceae bacterium]